MIPPRDADELRAELARLCALVSRWRPNLSPTELRQCEGAIAALSWTLGRARAAPAAAILPAPFLELVTDEAAAQLVAQVEAQHAPSPRAPRTSFIERSVPVEL